MRNTLFRLPQTLNVTGTERGRARSCSMRSGIRKGAMCCVVLYQGVTSALWAQAFQNLDFESANVSNLPPGQFEFVSIEDGLPSWNAYVGTNQLTQVTHNAISLGGANVGIWGPDYGSGVQPLQGAYTAILQAGVAGDAVSIAQTGSIPISANSLRFLGKLSFTNDLSVVVGGQSLPVVPLGSGSFGCDVSTFAGSIEEIRFTIAATHGSAENFLDAISFSPQAIPEPSTFALGAFGALALWSLRKRSRL